MLRFRLTLLFLLTGLILLTTLAIGATSYVNSQSAAQELSGQVLDQTSQRIDQEVENLLGKAAAQCSLTEELLKAHQLDVRDHRKLVGFWREMLILNSEITSMFIGMEATGESVGVSRLQKGRMSVWQTTRRAGSDALELNEYWAEDYPRQPFKPTVIGPDVRSRPWFVSVRQSRRPSWTETYIFLGVEGVKDVLGVTYSRPLLDEDGKLQAVLTADFDLEDLSRFLAALHIGKRGSAFLVELERNGSPRVIAHPRSEILVRRSPSGGKAAELASVEELDDERVKAFVKQLPAAVLSSDSPGETAVRFASGGENYLGSFHRIQGEGRPRWLVCTYLPETEVLAYAERINRLTLVIAAAVLAVSIFLGMYLSRQVARPLEQLAAESIAVGRLRLESRPRIRSIVLEVDQLAKAAEEMKAGLRSFEKYLPVDLVRGLLESGREAALGGEKRIVTVAFSDIAGFTSIAESLPTETLVAHLGEYLGALSREILDSSGTVDKFIGDAIMAFWGAPALNPQHARAACLSAIRCQQKLRELRPKWIAAGMPAFHTRFGIHTGEVIVGNIGSPERMNYTVIGDAANLASRLEGLNKYYGTEILISEPTYQEAIGAVHARQLDRVAVAGRAEPAPIYELMGIAGEATPEMRELSERYAAALDLYRGRRWREVLTLLEDMARLWPNDGPTRLLKTRCQQFLEAPPGDDWDGVHRMASK